MERAIELAQQAAAQGEVPVGALIVHNNRILVESHNEVEALPDSTAHAEILVIRKACALLGVPRLIDCDLYVTLEPCPMCASAISQARIRRLYYGAYDIKGGAVDHGIQFFTHPTCFHSPQVYGGIQEQNCSTLLQEFFRDKR